MSEIVLPEGDNQEEPEKLKYKATEADEERFFLMYNMNIQPSEAEAISDDYRKWLIARFIAQKEMEKEMIERHRLMQNIGPNLSVK